MAALKLKTFDLEHDSNGEAHRTNDYKSSELIVRRDQSFKIRMTFNRDVRKEDKLHFVVGTGLYPSESDNTQAIFPLSSSHGSSSWTAVKDRGDSNGLVVTISSPANAVIGRYKLSVNITSKQGKTSSFKLQGFILLFNPWSPDDDVFLDDEDARQEYVLNDNGIIYYGQEDFILEQGWNYGQFEENILNNCLAMLDRNLNYKDDPIKDCSRRNDPVYVGRVLSAMVNHFDDNGVVRGRWTGTFSGGVNPSTWIGSVDILNRWKRGGYKPVSFGQCWVFGGVLCTDRNLGVDQYFDITGQIMEETADSIWNYHVWNESWFVRKDIDSESAYSGWQVLDGTPQEKSEGIYCCGPTSIRAIKEGEVDLDFDAPFVYAEVNADRVTWIYYDDELKERVYSDTKSVGQKISTKAVGSYDRVDITHEYKYPEGSEKERAIYQKAREKLLKIGVLGKKNTGKRTIERTRRRTRRRDADTTSEDENVTTREPKKPQITGKFKLSERPLVSEDINLVLILNNLTSNRKTVSVNISSSSIKYTGQPTAEILRYSTSVTLHSHKEEHIPVHISASDYESELTDDNMIEVAAVCEVKNGGKLLVRKAISLGQPPINIKVPGQAVLNEPVEVEVTFTNPLAVRVKDARLVVEGSGLIKGQLRRRLPTLEPKESASIQFEITPTRRGINQLLAVFTSKKFSDIKGFQRVEVVEA